MDMFFCGNGILGGDFDDGCGRGLLEGMMRYVSWKKWEVDGRIREMEKKIYTPDSSEIFLKALMREIAFLVEMEGISEVGCVGKQLTGWVALDFGAVESESDSFFNPCVKPLGGETMVPRW